MEKSFRQNYNDALQKMNNITDRQRKILNAALDLFAEQGFDATSTSQIADRAGVAVGSVYHVFRNKRELLMGVMTTVFKSVFQSTADQFIDQTLGKNYPSFELFIRSLVDDRFQFIDDNFKVTKVIVGKLLTDSEFVNEIKEIFAKQLLKTAFPIIEQFKQQGVIVDWPNEDIIQVIFGPFAVHFGKLVFGVAPQSTDDKVRERKIACQSIVRALKVETK